MLAIKPRRGLGPLLFGMGRDDVRAVIGEPISRALEDPASEDWRYPGFSLAFDGERDWRFVSFEIWDEKAEIAGVRVFGRPFLAVLTDLGEVGLVDPEVRGSEEDGEIELYFRAHALHLWREGSRFTSLAAGVPFDQNDVELWPA